MTSSHDFDAISAAVMETDRGRWFMDEFARRNRGADTAAVLDALAGLEARLAPAKSGDAEAAIAQVGRLIVEIHRGMAAMRRELTPLPATNRGKRLLKLLNRLDGSVAGAAGAAGIALPADPVATAVGAIEAVAPAPEPNAPSAALVDADGEPPSGCGRADEGGAGSPDRPADDSAVILAIMSDPAAETAGRPDGPPEDGAVDAIAHGREQQAEPSPALAETDAEAPAEPSALIVEGHAIDIFADVAPEPQPRVAFDPPPAPRRPLLGEMRPRMPPAFMPKLLDSLSDEEKAVLFA